MRTQAIIPGTKGKPSFAKLSRQSTGMHPMDSGGACGRHWQHPIPSDRVHLELDRWTSHDGKETTDVMARIPLHAFLDAYLEIDHEMTKVLRKLENKAGHAFSYSEAQEALAEYLGLDCLGADYSYNWETDLTQNFQFTVVGPESSRDWYYADDVLILIETHNGADARGGFSDIVVCRPRTSSNGAAGLLDPLAEMRIESGFNADGSEMTEAHCRKIDERWEVGYSSYPMGAFMSDVAQVLAEIQEDSLTVGLIVKLNSGETVRAYVGSRMEYA